MLSLRLLKLGARALNTTVPSTASAPAPSAVLEPVFSEADLKRIKRIEAPRRALILEHQKAAKDGKILPMLHILEKIQEAMKSPKPTPMQQLESAISLQVTDSFDLFLEKKRTVYGSWGLELYGSERDHHFEALQSKGELVPANVRNEEEMMEYRKYFAVNFNLPGAIENINPNKFIRMKPVEEFDYLPIIPIAPSVMKRYKQEWEKKRKRGFKFNVDSAKAWSFGTGVICFLIFLCLIYMLYRTDEESWVMIEKARERRTKRQILF